VQTEDCERAVATKKLFAKKIEYLGRLLLDEEFSSLDVETDDFCNRLESQINHIRKSKSETGFRLARIGSTFLGVNIQSSPYVSDSEYAQIEKAAYDLRAKQMQGYRDLFAIGSAALPEAGWDEATGAIDNEDVSLVLSAIANLREKLTIAEAEERRLKEEALNCVESLKLSQQEVADLQQEVSDLRSRYTERYIQAVGIIIDVKQKLDELTTLNKV
jgi:hypothetical protein